MSECEKRSVPIQYLRSDEMLTGLMSVALFYRYFRNTLWNISLSPQKKLTTCAVGCYTVLVAHSSIAHARTRPTLYITSLKRRNYEHATWNKSTVPINHITVLCVLAGHEFELFICMKVWYSFYSGAVSTFH